MAVHGFHEPAARQGHDPLGQGIFVPVVGHPWHDMEKQAAGGAALGGGAPDVHHAVRQMGELEVLHPGLVLVADALGVTPDLPVGHTGMGAGVHGVVLREWSSP